MVRGTGRATTRKSLEGGAWRGCAWGLGGGTAWGGPRRDKLNGERRDRDGRDARASTERDTGGRCTRGRDRVDKSTADM